MLLSQSTLPIWTVLINCILALSTPSLDNDNSITRTLSDKEGGMNLLDSRAGPVLPSNWTLDRWTANCSNIFDLVTVTIWATANCTPFEQSKLYVEPCVLTHWNVFKIYKPFQSLSLDSKPGKQIITLFSGNGEDLPWVKVGQIQPLSGKQPPSGVNCQPNLPNVTALLLSDVFNDMPNKRNQKRNVEARLETNYCD
ncbi:hypothetical protein MMC14_002808 [Varicellaria rhodocarpa]|nr:hypothetical protein [Varicellaria rhodocarpa]